MLQTKQLEKHLTKLSGGKISARKDFTTVTKSDRERNSSKHGKVLKVKVHKVCEETMISLTKFKLLASIVHLGWRG